MAAPNIVNVATITGKSAYVDLSTTNATELVSNVDGSVAADITLAYYSQDDIGDTATELLSTVSVPQDSTLVAFDKNTAFYLEEDKSIGATASAANDLKVFVSYEEIS